MYDLSTANSYLMSMNVSVCTQTPCEQTYVVLDNVLLPKLQCTWNATFSNTGKLSELLPRSKYYCIDSGSLSVCEIKKKISYMYEIFI